MKSHKSRYIVLQTMLVQSLGSRPWAAEHKVSPEAAYIVRRVHNVGGHCVQQAAGQGGGRPAQAGPADHRAAEVGCTARPSTGCCNMAVSHQPMRTLNRPPTPDRLQAVCCLIGIRVADWWSHASVGRRAAEGLLADMPLGKIRNFGGKLGAELQSMGCTTPGQACVSFLYQGTTCTFSRCEKVSRLITLEGARMLQCHSGAVWVAAGG